MAGGRGSGTVVPVVAGRGPGAGKTPRPSMTRPVYTLKPPTVTAVTSDSLPGEPAAGSMSRSVGCPLRSENCSVPCSANAGWSENCSSS